jgi:hypothetical protein
LCDSGEEREECNRDSKWEPYSSPPWLSFFGPFWGWPIFVKTVGILRLLGAEFIGKVWAQWGKTGEAKQLRGPALLPV